MHTHILDFDARARHHRNLGGSTASVLLHAVLIGLAVTATAPTAREIAKAADETLRFTELQKEEPPPPPPEPEPERVYAPPGLPAAPPMPKGFQVLAAPVDIPDVIPKIDLSRAVTREEDFSGRGIAGGRADGIVGVPLPKEPPKALEGTGAYFEFQVERPVQVVGGPPPVYPPMLREARMQGRVLAQFVVDSTGRALAGSFKPIDSSHDLFTLSVRDVLPAMEFRPAEVGGRKVRQLVQQEFIFALKP